MPVVCSFLLHLFKEGLSSSSINIARSALNFFSLSSLNLNEEPCVNRLFKYFYKKRPLLKKYITYWPVSQLLNFLSEWHPIHELSLKQLTLKTVALIALTSSDRGQTLHLINIEHCSITEHGISFIIFNRLKQHRKSITPKTVQCVNSDIPSLNVADYVTAYLNRTLPIRAQHVAQGSEKPKRLFLSWATKKEVTKQTILRWLTSVLKLAGIDTSHFSAHSYRGAGLSAAYSKGVPLDKIIAHGDWKNCETFKKHYDAPSSDTPIGQVILNCYNDGKYNESQNIHGVIV